MTEERGYFCLGPVLDDGALDLYLDDVGVVELDGLAIGDFRLSEAGAKRVARAFSYSALYVERFGEAIPAENILPILKPTLTRLEIHGAFFKLCPNPFDHLAGTLEHLDFSSTNLDERALECFRGSKVLYWLKCNSTRVGIAALEIASGIESLRYIGLAGNGITVHDVMKCSIPAKLEVGI